MSNEEFTAQCDGGYYNAEMVIVLKRIAASFLIIICVLSFIGAIHADSGAGVVVSDSFERESGLWGKVTYHNDLGFNDSGCIEITGYPAIENSQRAAYLGYEYPITLKKDNVYRLSFQVKAANLQTDKLARAEISQPENQLMLQLDIYNAGMNWHKIDVVFQAKNDGGHSLDINIWNNAHSVYYIDDFLLLDMPRRAAGIALEGETLLVPPESGTSVFSYNAVVLDQFGYVIDGLNGRVSAEDGLPEGVTFDESLQQLIITDDARVGDWLLLTCEPPEDYPLIRRAFIVRLANNRIVNGGFDSLPLGYSWSAEEPVNIVEYDQSNCAKLYLDRVEENEFMSSIHNENIFDLKKGVDYILRFKVRSEHRYQTEGMLISPPVISNGALNVDVRSVGGGIWEEFAVSVKSAEDTRLTLSINLYSPHKLPAFIEDVSLIDEPLRPSSVRLIAPRQLCRTTEVPVATQFVADVLNQLGEAMPNESVTIELSPPNSGIGISESARLISVGKRADLGEFTLTAVCKNYPEILERKNITISDNPVADGGFEGLYAWEYWSSFEPAGMVKIKDYMDTTPTEGDFMARITYPPEQISLIINDSYAGYKKGRTYVFNARVKSLDSRKRVVVPIILDDAFSNEIDSELIVKQYEITTEGWNEISFAFTVPYDCVARPAIAFLSSEPPSSFRSANSQKSISALLDDVSIRAAVITAQGAELSGFPAEGGTLTADYVFYNDMERQEGASAFSWLISGKDGGFTSLPFETDRTLSLKPEYINSYVACSITPVTEDGFAGEAVVTHPRRITKAPFTDVNRALWAYEEIITAYERGVINPDEQGAFSPDHAITRAQLAVMICRALNLAADDLAEYSDVHPDAWYANAVNAVSGAGIMQGVGDGSFAPDSAVTRQQLVTILTRAADVEPEHTAPLTFEDAAEISDWAVSGVAAAVEKGIVRGYEDNTFRPMLTATRIQAVYMLIRSFS